MAEAHPVGFQWVVEAKKRGARVIHVDPRFTRTSALAHQHVPIRVGSDIAFLGGIINYVLENELDFRDYVVNYTNAATIVSDKFEDADDLDGLFSGFDPETRTYDPTSWQYDVRGRRRRAAPLAGRQLRRPRRAPRHRRRAAARVARLAGERAPAARRDAAAPALRLPGAQAPLRALHPRGRRAGLRRLPGRLPRGVPGVDGELRSRAHHRAGLQRRLDPAQRRRAVHPRRRDPPAAARQHGPPRRRHHGAARPREHPGLDRHPDAVQHPPGLPADAQRRPSTRRSPTGSTASATPARRASGPTPAPTASTCSRPTGATRRRPTTTSASTTCRASPATTAPTAPCST